MTRQFVKSVSMLLWFAQTASAVQFTLDLSGGSKPLIHVPCTLDTVTSQCLLDTGSAFSTIPSQQNVEPWTYTGDFSSLGVGGSHPACKKYRVPQFRVADTTKTNFEIPQCQEATSSRRGGIGIDYFEGHSLTLNFEQNELIIDPPFDRSGQPRYPLERLKNGQLKVPIIVGDEPITALFDTAASPTVIDQDFIDSHSSNFEYVKDVTGSDGTIEGIKMKVYKAKNIKLGVGNFQFNDTWVVAMPLPASLKSQLDPRGAIILGLSHLIQLNWHFDLNKNYWNYSN